MKQCMRGVCYCILRNINEALFAIFIPNKKKMNPIDRLVYCLLVKLVLLERKLLCVT